MDLNRLNSGEKFLQDLKRSNRILTPKTLPKNKKNPLDSDKTDR